MTQINGRLTAQENITGTLNGTGGGGGGATALTQLTDVNISNPSNGQGLLYNADSAKWVNAPLPTGVDELSELNDVDTFGAQVSDVLMYMNMGSGDNKWTPYPARSISERFFNDYELDVLWVMNIGRAQISFDNDVSNKVIDLHFTAPNVCPDSVEVSFDQTTSKWWIRITIPSDYYDESLKCLLTLRDKKGS